MIPIRNTLDDLNQKQPENPIQVHNATAVGFIHKQIKQSRSKAICMRFYWLQDRQQQQKFNECCKEGMKNLAEYFSKHFPPAHHRKKRSLCLHIREKIHRTFKSMLYYFDRAFAE